MPSGGHDAKVRVDEDDEPIRDRVGGVARGACSGYGSGRSSAGGGPAAAT
jgi:hypothetical protein